MVWLRVMPVVVLQIRPLSGTREVQLRSVVSPDEHTAASIVPTQTPSHSTARAFEREIKPDKRSS